MTAVFCSVELTLLTMNIRFIYLFTHTGYIECVDITHATGNEISISTDYEHVMDGMGFADFVTDNINNCNYENTIAPLFDVFTLAKVPNKIRGTYVNGFDAPVPMLLKMYFIHNMSEIMQRHFAHFLPDEGAKKKYSCNIYNILHWLESMTDDHETRDEHPYVSLLHLKHSTSMAQTR